MVELVMVDSLEFGVIHVEKHHKYWLEQTANLMQ
jgi:hypothetical protein